MKRTRFDDAACPIARTTDLMGDWWTPMVMREAFLGRRRFDEFQQALLLSRGVLSKRLSRLVEEGLLESPRVHAERERERSGAGCDLRRGAIRTAIRLRVFRQRSGLWRFFGSRTHEPVGQYAVEIAEHLRGRIGAGVRQLLEALVGQPQQTRVLGGFDRGHSAIPVETHFAEHVAALIEPALAKGQVVLSDRYTLSSVAYQGARGLDADAILADGEREFPIPDLVIVISVSPELGTKRVNARGGTAEPVFEEIEFQREVAAEFSRIARSYVETVDGSGSPEDVHARVCEVCDPVL